MRGTTMDVAICWAHARMTNNAAERSLRGVVVGRKKHYSSKSVRGTEVVALFYSRIVSAKLCRVQPKACLRAAAELGIESGPPLLPHEFKAGRGREG